MIATYGIAILSGMGVSEMTSAVIGAGLVSGRELGFEERAARLVIGAIAAAKGYSSLKDLLAMPTEQLMQSVDVTVDWDKVKGDVSVGENNILNFSNKADALKSVDNLPSNIQSKTKDFFKGASNSYTDFSVKKMENGNYMAEMMKPGDVPGSKAIYYKEIDSGGNTIKVFKETFDPEGNLIHTKNK